jgi:hypothetical protein
VNLGDAITQAKMHVRRDSWLQDPDWKALFNAAQMEFAQRTGVYEDDFDVSLLSGVAEYNFGDVGFCRFTENPCIGTTELAVVTRAGLRAAVGTDLTVVGTPTHVYPASPGFFAVYPIPDVADNGVEISCHGLYYPAEIVVETPSTTELPGEVVDHPALVYGAVLRAERLDKSIVISREVREDWERAIMNARFRVNTRIPGGTRTKT